MTTWWNVTLLAFGSAMMLLALVRAQRLSPRIAPATSPGSAHRRAWRILCTLMALFLVGYFAALVLLILGRHDTLAGLTAVIFAGGAWFVLLTVSLTVGLANSLLDASEDLEGQVRQRTTDLESQAQILEQARHDAEAANRAKSSFLANMSHELRTPLNSVVGFANVLRKNKAGNLTSKDLLYLERILHNGTHLLSLINDILDLSKVESGHMEVHLEVIDVAELLRRLTGQFSVHLRERPVELLLELPSPVAPLTTDVGKLTQVLVNLIGNALKFTAEGQVRVVVSVERESRRVVRIDVVDTGIGIPAQKLETIFEAFRQAEHRTSREYGGTGLGLFISRSLCQVLGYTLDVHSRCAGEGGEGPSGSTFTITLLEEPEEVVKKPLPERDTYHIRPLTDSELARTLAEELAGRTVVVVADRSAISHAIRQLGAGVVEAVDAATALDMVQRSLPDLLILDGGEALGEGLEGLLEEHARGLPMVALMDEKKLVSLPDSVTCLPRRFKKSQLLTVLWRLIVRRSRFDTTPPIKEDSVDEP